MRAVRTRRAQPPPQHGAPGGRPALDRRWVAYLLDGGALGDAAEVAGSGLLARGIDEFNRGDFLASHETWEALWGQVSYPTRLLCLALTKLGAGFAHAQRANRHGAARLLRDALDYLAPFLPAHAGLDTRQLDADVRRWLEAPDARTAPYPTIRRGSSA